MSEQEKNSPELHGARIEDYALIGDCETAALVCSAGSIDWLCWPDFSSGACFAALLGTKENGYWKIAPAGEVTARRRRYSDGTLVVETTFETAEGEVCLIDFMPPREKHSDVVRIVRGVRGKVPMRMDLCLRFDYGRTIPWVTSQDHHLRAIVGPHMVLLRSDAEMHGENLTTVSDFTVSEGQSISFVLTYASSLDEDPEPVNAEAALKDTEAYWREWADRSTFKGEYADVVRSSLMVLKALTYRPTGGIVAAPTTSLPEHIGGVRNWDYRYCWPRDTAFTLLILMNAGYEEEAIAWRQWLMRAVAGSPAQLQAIYGLAGERQLVEWEVDWLPGYENSKPVRVGNAAVGQLQLDVYGEVAAALSRTPPAQGEWSSTFASLHAGLIDHLCEIWREPDEGIWETRGGRKQFVHSKVMAWVAMERAVKTHERLDGAGDVEKWKRVRDEIHADVCEHGFDPELNSFVQSYGSKELDASCLRIPLVGFLPPTDPRVRGTVEAIEKGLQRGGFVLRYDTETSDDGLPVGEGVFLACSFWMAACLWLIDRKDDAKQMYERLLALRNDTGLLSEEYDPREKRMLGNFPQALSHIAMAHVAYVMAGLTPVQQENHSS